MSYSLLCDIGGTHARIATLNHDHLDEFTDCEKFQTIAFANLTNLIEKYLVEHNLSADQLDRILIASAVRPKDDIITFDTSIKTTPWVINPRKIEKQLNLKANAIRILLDTEAQFLGIESPHIKTENRISLKEGKEAAIKTESDLLISIGTGLGHSYKPHGQTSPIPTFGGHMPPLTNSPEQIEALNFIQEHKTGRKQLIFEDVVSGRGFYNLYAFSCATLNIETQMHSIEELSGKINALKNDQNLQNASRLFCEFLGLYIHMTALCTHSYGNCTIIGGLPRTLHKLGLFETNALKQDIELDMVDSVKEKLSNMSVSLITKEHLSLYGLMSIA